MADKYDRVLKISDMAIATVAIAMSLYHLIYTQYLLVQQIGHINAHYFFGFTLVLLLGIKKRPHLWWLMLILWGLVVACTAYIGYYQVDIQMRVGIPTNMDLAIGSLFVALSFIAGWMAFGPVLPIIGIIFISYYLFGHLMPGFLFHFPA